MRWTGCGGGRAQGFRRAHHDGCTKGSSSDLVRARSAGAGVRQTRPSDGGPNGGSGLTARRACNKQQTREGCGSAGKRNAASTRIVFGGYAGEMRARFQHSQSRSDPRHPRHPKRCPHAASCGDYAHTRVRRSPPLPEPTPRRAPYRSPRARTAPRACPAVRSVERDGQAGKQLWRPTMRPACVCMPVTNELGPAAACSG
jgi:hypothetical protein